MPARGQGCTIRTRLTTKTFDHDVIRRIDKGEIDEVWFWRPYSGTTNRLWPAPVPLYHGEVTTRSRASAPRHMASPRARRSRDVARPVPPHRARCPVPNRMACGGTGPTGPGSPPRHPVERRRRRHVPLPAERRGRIRLPNPRTVQSTADDWLKYPKLTGEKKFVNRESWGGPDYHRNYIVVFARIPNAPGKRGRAPQQLVGVHLPLQQLRRDG